MKVEGGDIQPKRRDPPMQTTTNAVILARVSSKAQEDEGYSLDSQLKLLKNYCQTNKLNIIREFKIAETASKDQRRSIFREMLRYIARNKIYHLAVEKTDRLTRNYRDAIAIDDWLNKDERRVLHMVKENLQLHKESKSDTKFMWNIYIAVANKYTNNLREEAMKGWAEKLAQGWMPSTPPPGYMTVTENNKHIHARNPDTAPLMERVFEFFSLEGNTLKNTMEFMATLGITTSRGRPYVKSAVHKILTNPFYVGTIHFNGKDYPGAQEPIISQELFDKVQEKMHQGKRGGLRKHNPVFKGMIRCESCGHVVTWQLQKGRFYGACQRTTEVCRSKKLLREDRLEKQVMQKMEQVQDSDGKILAKIKASLCALDPSTVGAYREKAIESLEKQIEHIEHMQDRLYDDKLSGRISQHKYDDKCQQFADNITEIKRRLLRLHEAQGLSRAERAAVVQHSKSRIVQIYLRSAPEQKRVILSVLFKSGGFI